MFDGYRKRVEEWRWKCESLFLIVRVEVHFSLILFFLPSPLPSFLSLDLLILSSQSG